jgi:DNA-binding NarL/FixJ family response regulator
LYVDERDLPWRCPMTEPIRVVLVDDDESIRKLIRWTLDMDPRFKVVGEAFDGRSAMRTIEMERPDAVVLDLLMPNMDGYNALTQIPYSSPDSKIMILTDAEVEPRILASKGAHAVRSKGDTIDGHSLAESLVDLVAADSYF